MLIISGATAHEKRLLKKVERACFKELGQKNFFCVDVKITDAGTIRELNKSARGVDNATDVLSFPSFEGLKLPVSKSEFSDSDFDGRFVALGDIMICRERASEQAEEFGHSYERELGFLLCHGLLHILGFDHIKEEDERVMLDMQKRVMKRAGLKRAL